MGEADRNSLSNCRILIVLKNENGNKIITCHCKTDGECHHINESGRVRRRLGEDDVRLWRNIDIPNPPPRLPTHNITINTQYQDSRLHREHYGAALRRQRIQNGVEQGFEVDEDRAVRGWFCFSVYATPGTIRG